MKRTIRIVAVGILVFCFRGTALADRALSPSEISNILQGLTQHPQATWISVGTIEAVHEEYRAPKILDQELINQKIEQSRQEYIAKTDKPERDENLQKMKLEAIPFNIQYEYNNEYTMTSKIIVRYDGTNYYWDTEVLARTDTIRPPVEHTFMYEYFNLDWNRRRISARDGGKMTRYHSPINHAIVMENTGDVPSVVNGPLTAGIIPWGYGHYAYNNLMSAELLLGTEISNADTIKTQFDIHKDGKEISITLDPDKNYAAMNCVIVNPGISTLVKTYGSYQLISGRWIPTLITIEKYSDATADAGRLLERDIWNITTIHTDVPSHGSYHVDYADGAQIDYYSPLVSKPQHYLFFTPQESNSNIDSESLLSLRLDIAANIQSHNCATAAMKYISEKMANPLTDSQLSTLINLVDRSTSFQDLKQFAINHGFYSKAVIADIQTLKSLKDCQVILHFPGKNHFVVVGNIDDQSISVIDLTKDKFFYKIDLTQIHLDWENNVALVLSRNPIQIPDGVVEMPDSAIANIMGAACTTGFYSCTKLLQSYAVFYCTYSCDGVYEIYETRYGCECAASGSCQSSTDWLRLSTSLCIDAEIIGCTISGDWIHYYMRACM